MIATFDTVGAADGTLNAHERDLVGRGQSRRPCVGRRAEEQDHNPVVVARDGVEALDYPVLHEVDSLTGTPLRCPPVLLDLKLPSIDGLEASCRSAPDQRTAPPWLC